jgi:two-component system sensor histidine kinase YesM
MKILKYWSRRLIPRFIAIYLLVLVLPSAMTCYFIYTNAVKSARDELMRAKREATFADRLYFQNQLQNVESKYFQFKNSKSLNNVLDSTYRTDRSVMYEYIRELSDLIYDNQSDADYIREVRLYTSNATAAKILPAFFPIADLYVQPMPRSFQENPRLALFLRFWDVTMVDDSLTFTYYAGLMDTLYQRVNGVLAIVCGDELFELFLDNAIADVSTYLYLDDQLVYSRNSAPERDALLGSWSTLSVVDNADIKLDEATGFAISRVDLPERNMKVVQIYPFPRIVVLPTGFWFAIGVFLILSILLFISIFKPLRNIAKLSRHLETTQTVTLLPYAGKAGVNEVGDLIFEYNCLVERTNELSRTIRQNEILLRNAQIEMLQSQLNPHFFYGTLENIRMIAEMHGEKLIAEIAFSFGNLMRYSLSREFFVSLEREIDVVRQYIEIQKKRLRDRFTVAWEIEADTDAWKCPKFVLFSMVENAFTHDVNRTRRTVHISIAICESGDQLTISITNDGPGVDPERLALIRRLIRNPEERAQMSTDNNGRSIFNISDRLRLYYGNNYLFSISSEPDRLTTCSVTIKRNARELEKEVAGNAHRNVD